jgi:hypothetical protein
VHCIWRNFGALSAVQARAVGGKMPSAASAAAPAVKVGQVLRCRWLDGSAHAAEVVEERPAKHGGGFEYYVHYQECACGCALVARLRTLRARRP